MDVVQLHDNGFKALVFSLQSELERRCTVGVHANPSGHVASCQNSLSDSSSSPPASSPWLWVNAPGCLPSVSLHFSFLRRRRRLTLFSSVTLENMRKSKQRPGHWIFGGPDSLKVSVFSPFLLLPVSSGACLLVEGNTKIFSIYTSSIEVVSFMILNKCYGIFWSESRQDFAPLIIQFKSIYEKVIKRNWWPQDSLSSWTLSLKKKAVFLPLLTNRAALSPSCANMCMRVQNIGMCQHEQVKVKTVI